MRLLIAFASLCFLAAPATAHAGGWATVQLDRPLGAIEPGKPTRVGLIVKQHGITPLDDARPSLVIDDGRGAVHTFQAHHAGRPGTYVATVTFPTAGTWKTRIFDGWTDATPHRLAPIEVPRAAAPVTAAAAERPVRLPAVPQVAAQPAGFPTAQVAAAAAMALLWLGLWVTVSGRVTVPRRERRAARGRPRPAS